MLVIGSYDRLDFPVFDLHNIKCKIDTGADTSSIHCHNIKIIQRGKKELLSFKLLDPHHKQYDNKSIIVSEFAENYVKSSSGHTQLRYFISSQIILFDKTFEIDFSLADRSVMSYPVLIGRKFLKDNKILVDVCKTNISCKKKGKK